jgi:hypothetical protein
VDVFASQVLPVLLDGLAQDFDVLTDAGVLARSSTA